MSNDLFSKEQYIACPHCHGVGRKTDGEKCDNCNGYGQGYFYLGKFLYIDGNYEFWPIFLSRSKKYADQAVNFISLIIFAGGIISLGFWIWQMGSLNYNFLSQIWIPDKPSLFLNIFWFSLLSGMFAIYRIQSESSRKKDIQVGKGSKSHFGKLPDNWQDLCKIKKSQRIESSLVFSNRLERLIEKAVKKSSRAGNSVDEVSLFYQALSDNLVRAVFFRLNIDPEELAQRIKNYQKNNDFGKSGNGLSVEAKSVLLDAYLQASKMKQARLQPYNMLAPIISRNKDIADILSDFCLDQQMVANVVNWLVINEQLHENYRLYKKMARFKPSSGLNRSYTAVATPVLDFFSQDLTQAAKWGRLEFCVGREREIDEIFQNFTSGKNGIVLAGSNGVGKTSILYGIAQSMVKEEVPKFLQDKKLLELDIARLVSGIDPAQATGRLEVIIDEIVRAGNVVLCIENIENIIGFTSGGESSLELSEVLSNALEKKYFYCLSTISQENYTKYLEPTALSRQLSKVFVREPKDDQAILIIESKIGYLENKYKVIFTYHAIDAAVKLSDKYLHEQYLPEKAIAILEKAAVKYSADGQKNYLVDREEVALVVSEQSGVPVASIGQQESELLLNLESEMRKYIIGQTEAITNIADSLRRARVNLRSGKRPIASFLFLGPTGVGKTEVAKTVAKVYFQNERFFIRLDMSEYQTPDSVEKMIGSQTGVVGYLTEAVRRSPYALILLDEFEKAHPNILNLFLQVMDDGRLTDGQGRTIDFTNCIIIATSNIGAIYIEDQVRAGIEISAIKQGLINEQLNKSLKPELINRFDGIVVFKPLTLIEVEQITRLMLKQTEKALIEKGVVLELTDAGVGDLAKLGFDPAFGARPLRRVIQDRIENEIAKLLLSGELSRRDILVLKENTLLEIKKARKI